MGNLPPNPVVSKAKLPITLHQSATVKCLLCDINCRNLGEVFSGQLGAGAHELGLDLANYNLAAGNYAYVVRVINAGGTFGESRVLIKQ